MVIVYFVPMVYDVCISHNIPSELLEAVIGGLVMVEGSVSPVMHSLGGHPYPFDTCSLEVGGEAGCS
jgi:hypothetical protein